MLTDMRRKGKVQRKGSFKGCSPWLVYGLLLILLLSGCGAQEEEETKNLAVPVLLMRRMDITEALKLGEK